MRPEINQRIDERLTALYQRNQDLEPGAVDSFYDSARGYYGLDEAGDEADRFGIALVTPDGEVHSAGDAETPFALQSISKVFVYGLALADRGRDHVLERVGVEPSGDPFNAIEFDERKHRPYNPMVNAGALVTTDLVRGSSPEHQLERILAVFRLYAGNEALEVDQRTLQHERRGADRNRATAYLMRSLDMVDGDVEAILDLYLQQCSIRVTCRDLAVMAATLANGGINPVSGDRVLPRDRVRDVLSVMHTCGMYDAAGQWAYDVGLPAKSGVSGGIGVAVPGKGGIAVWSPGLDGYGNSARGVQVCHEISTLLGLHVFATEDEDALLGSTDPEFTSPPA
jgi:glutaminase